MPPDLQSWVELMQYSLFTPNLRITDEFALIDASIDPHEDLAIQRRTIEDHFEEMLPQIIMADSREAAIAMLDNVLAFAEANGLALVEERYNTRFQYNKTLQGGSIFNPPPMP